MLREDLQNALKEAMKTKDMVSVYFAFLLLCNNLYPIARQVSEDWKGREFATNILKREKKRVHKY